MTSPGDRRYTETHEWHKLDGDTITIGISRFAVDELTGITYVEFSRRDGPIKAGETFGEIESVKAVNDLFTPISGEVIEVNGKLKDAPELVNEDPYGEGWMLRVKIRDAAEIDALLTAKEYMELIEDAE